MLKGEIKELLAREAKRQFARKLRSEMTPSEEMLWNALRNRRFKNLKFRRQVPIGPFIVDFLCMKHNLIIEVDGAIHEKRKGYDQERTVELEAQGYKILRFTNDEVEQEIPKILKAISNHIYSQN